MNELKLYPIKCPQCGAPEVVREGTRITPCERCGAKLCLSELRSPRYEVLANLSAAQAVGTARNWLDKQGKVGLFGRPELVFLPFHEICGRRVGVFERKVPERHRVYRERYKPGTGETVVEPEYEYTYKEDTKVMVADVEHITPAARSPWNLAMFDARAARRLAPLSSFDLVEAQRRATVYAEEQSPDVTGAERFAKRDTEMIASSRRTLFFPFFSIPVQAEGGSYEMVVDGVCGNVVAWRLPEAFEIPTLAWAALAVPGAVALGQALHATFLGDAFVDPVIMFVIGTIATVTALFRANRPDWRLRRWPEPGTIPRLERSGS
ncbi:MAG: hypothetical protein JSV86_05715 [Gemmatimonadota bacterium]|nr:MAG: hypothetical protein JSV86_05715 [Gemmatimonadota bacterium]